LVRLNHGSWISFFCYTPSRYAHLPELEFTGTFYDETSTGKQVQKSERMGLLEQLATKVLISKSQGLYITIFDLEFMKQIKIQSEFPSHQFKVKRILSSGLSLLSETLTKRVTRSPFGLKAKAS
jgi:hypothetical protein